MADQKRKKMKVPDQFINGNKMSKNDEVTLASARSSD